MGLAKVVRTVKDEHLLKNLIASAVKEKRKSLPIDPSSPSSYVRCSGISTMCPREEVLVSLLNVDIMDEVSGDLGVTFAHGNALHHVLQNDILPRANVLIGVWRCNECGARYGRWEPDKGDPMYGLVPRPVSCIGCDSHATDLRRADTLFFYEEVTLVNTEIRLTGHPDGFLRMPGMPGIGQLEIKSVSERSAWEIRNVPDIGHVMQVQAYMLLTGLKWAKILYWNKAGFGLSAFVEHFVERDENTITKIKDMIESIFRGLNGGFLPSRICSTISAPRAKQCPVAKPCFKNEEMLVHDPVG